MTLSDAMKDFINERRVRMAIEDVTDAFIESFLPDDEEAAIAAVNVHWQKTRAESVTARQGVVPGQPQATVDLLTAPFRFIPLNETVVLPEPEIRAAWKSGTLHSLPLAKGYSGQLHLKIVFDDAMLVGQPDGENASGPMKLGADHVIPGATLRGMTRAMLDTIAFAKLTQTNRHRRFGIRDFEHDLFNDEARKAVRAGWLRPSRPDDGVTSEYVIEPCRWYRIRIRDLKQQYDSASEHHNWLKKDLTQHYQAFGMVESQTINFNKTFSFYSAGDDHDGALASLSAQGRQGVLVFSDKVPSIPDNGLTDADATALRNARRNREKGIIEQLEIKALDAQDRVPQKGNAKRTEAIFADEGGAPLPLPKAVWETFLDSNTRSSAHKRKAIGNWAKLAPTLEAGQRLPVFWVGNGAGEVSDFGIVRVFKRAHTSTVGEVLARTGQGVHLADPDSPDFCPDFVEALFGYAYEPEDKELSSAVQHENRHLKSRISFGFARLAEGCRAQETEKIPTVQAAPKPSFGAFYLAADGRKDWSAPGVELAGRKVYVPRNASVQHVRENLGAFAERAGNRRDENRTGSTLRMLTSQKPNEKLTFVAEIFVHNVTAAELGGLVWALTLGGNEALRHMIGRARTAGAGQASIEVSTETVADLHGKSIPVAEARDAFVEYISREVRNWQQSEPIKAFLRSANPSVWEHASLEYLELKKHRDLRKQAYDARPPKRYLGA